MNIPSRTLARFLIASAIAFSISFAADAHPPMEGHGGSPMMPGEHGGPGGHHMIPFLHELNPSEAQQDKIFDILHALEPQMRDKAKLARKARHELQEMSLSDRFDEARARTLADGAARAEADMALLRARSTQQVLAVLTAEQRKQAAEPKQRFESRRADDEGPRGPRPRHGMPGGPGPLRERGEH